MFEGKGCPSCRAGMKTHRRLFPGIRSILLDITERRESWSEKSLKAFAFWQSTRAREAERKG